LNRVSHEFVPPPPACEIGPGSARDLPWLRCQLLAADLPAADLDGLLPDGLLVARLDGRPAGAVGLEAAGADGLLRSLVVAPDARGRGCGRALVAALERLAAGRGIRRLYLLTTTAADFFPRLGYRPTERGRVPPGIAATAEFRELCPAAAACMSRSLGV
jgi:amino-acid N-acetyltransferase